MKEVRPPSAILVEKVQKRYIKNRNKIGPPSKSVSEPVLSPLKQKGVLFGLSDSWNVCKSYLTDEFEGQKLWLATILFVIISGTEFALITLGVPAKVIDDDGHWNIIEKINDNLG